MEEPKNIRPANPLAERVGVRVGLSPILGIFLTVFIDLLSFGLVIPDLQLRGQELGLSGLALGMTLGTFSLAQLLTSPFLGRLSDRIGRRKVLLVTTVLSTASFVVYAHVHVVWMIVVARILAGVAGANIGVAFAYIADVTEPQNRAKGLGAVGAAFGLGFIFGPPLGAWLVHLGNGDPLVLGYTAATLAFLNFLYVLLILPESRRHDPDAVPAHFFENFRIAFTTPALAILLLMFFAVNFGFTNLESTFFQLLHDSRGIFQLSEQEARARGAIVLSLVGLVGGIIQGGLIRMLVPRFGEVKLLRFGYLLMGPALALVPFAPYWGPALVLAVSLAIGMGLAQPSLSALVSRNAPSNIQGGVFGITQSLGALARFLGPLASNAMFAIKPQYPYLIGAAVILFPAAAAWTLKQPHVEHH